jgi:hypothetical protein
VGFLVYYNLIHVATHGYARYRLPVLPVLFVGAALSWAAGRSPALLSKPRKAVAAGAALVLVLSLIPSFRLWAADRALGAPEREAPEEPGPP